MNIVLIVADTFRADRVDLVQDGRPLMPNLAAFAAESWYFRNCRCQAAWTKPSMTTLFTSLYPDVHRVLFTIDEKTDAADSPKSDKLPELFETMAEYLKSHGYATAGIQSNVHITEHFGFAQGFDSYVFRKPHEFHADDITDEAIKQLDKNSRPFFLYVHYMDTHGPYDIPKDNPDRPLPPPELTDGDRELLDNWNDGYLDRVFFDVGLKSKRTFGNFSKVAEDFIRTKYDASAHFLDGELARLTAYVTAQYPNTIIVITSDHGEELFEHGSLGHGKTVYEEVSRVPLIVKVPGATPQSIDAPVGLIDVLPTCASLLGLSQKPEWQGVDLAKDLANLSLDRPIFGSAQMTIAGSNCDLDSVVIGMRKLIVDKKKGTELVFDLAADRSENGGVPLSDNSADLAFTRALEQHDASNMAHPLRQETPETTQLTAEQQERLRMIGYVQ